MNRQIRDHRQIGFVFYNRSWKGDHLVFQILCLLDTSASHHRHLVEVEVVVVPLILVPPRVRQLDHEDGHMAQAVENIVVDSEARKVFQAVAAAVNLELAREVTYTHPHR